MARAGFLADHRLRINGFAVPRKVLRVNRGFRFGFRLALTWSSPPAGAGVDSVGVVVMAVLFLEGLPNRFGVGRGNPRRSRGGERVEVLPSKCTR